MRDYIILNGVNSNTITGLLISTLPPITKPKIRTQTEEIDGRDGDIVTTLGYSAYDKEIQIGLYGNFNINEVIAYFNTAGTVTFSNEPDKYYNYQILDQIDYEKLIRFKTAKVKMHVQPFKYPLEETPVEINIQNVTGSGEAVDINNTAEAPVTLALKGNTSQDGTPTPEAPVEVNTVTGRQEIKVVGKNIIPTNDIQETTTNGLTYSCTNGTLRINGTATANTTITLATNLNIPVATTGYRISVTKSGTTTSTSATYIQYLLRNSSNANLGYVNQIVNNTSASNGFQTAGNINTTILYIISGVVFQNAVFNFQVEKNTTATAYEPYQSQSYELDLGNLELCKIGDYQDYIYKDNNKWYIKRQVGKLALNGSEDWSTRSSGVGQLYELNVSSYGFYNTESQTLGFSNQYVANINLNVDNTFRVLSGATLGVHNDTIGSLTNFKNGLSTNNLIVYFPLKTPEDEEITDNTLIGQLNALENARSYDTTTHINQNTANKPFIINATAVQKGTDTGTVDNIGNIYAKPTIDIEGSGIVEIYLDGNQIFNVDLSSSNECVIDTTNLEAYNPATTQLMNRQVTGDYSNFKISVGDNQVKVSGAVTKATISNYTRWL